MNLQPMAAGALTIVRTCAGVASGEHVLIVTDIGVPREVADALAFAATAAGGIPATLTMQRPERPGAEPPRFVAEAMKHAHVVLAPTSLSIFHTEAARNACAAGARMLAISECRAETLAGGGITADFAAQAEVAERLARRLAGEVLDLRTPAGTRLRTRLGGRAAVANTGRVTHPGARSGVPTIEAYIAPLEGTAEGTAVIDASVGVLGLVASPLTITFSGGRAVAFEGRAQASALRDVVERVGSADAFMLSEVGIGLNPQARVVGRIIEDEGTYGTCHIALGSNIHFGGRLDVPFHLDMVMWAPDILVDGRVLMEGGRLVEEAAR
jgi:leucyl aminopeptidase (aminopeptidase T)